MVIESTATNFWVCPSCLKEIPWFHNHICPAQSKRLGEVAVFPAPELLLEINRKLDLIVDELIKIKKDKDK